MCERCSKLLCGACAVPLVRGSHSADCVPDVCRTCQQLERHYGVDLRVITFAQRRAFLASANAAGYASMNEAERYPDRPSWPPAG